MSGQQQPHFTSGKDPVPIVQEARWAPGPVLTGGKSRPQQYSITGRPDSSSVATATKLPDSHTCIHTYIHINVQGTSVFTSSFAVRCFPKDIFLLEQQGNPLLDIYLQNIKYNQIERNLRHE